MKCFPIGIALLSLVALSGCKKSETPAPPAAAEAATAALTAAHGDEAAPAQEPAAAAGEAAPQAAAPPTSAGPAAAPQIPEIIATVNGVELKSDEYRAEVERIAARGAQMPEERMQRIRQDILKRLIEQELIRQEIEKEGIEVTDEEIDAEFEEYKKRFRTEEQFENYLRHGKVSVEQIRERMAAKRQLEKLIAKASDTEVSEEEARAFYEQNERFYMEKEGVRASHILVKVDEDAPEERVAEAMEKVRMAQAELAKGTAFDEVARNHSEGPSAPKGGELGFFGRGQMVKEFEDVAFTMDAEDVSDPVRTRFGFHIIKVFEKREERKRPFEDVRSQIEESLRNKRFFQERRQLLRRLHEAAKVESFL
jgi:peptidyl-prolyl cis-trans isomerase C